jgi:hypothetical protein
MSLNASEATSPSKHFVNVTPSDTVDLARLPKGLYISGAGNVVCQNIDGTSATFTAVPAGTVLPIRAKRVLATGTTATGIVSLA